MGEPIDIGEVRVGDRVRATNAGGQREDTVTQVRDTSDGYRFVYVGNHVFGGRPRDAAPYTRFVLLDRPKAKAARALAELAVTKQQVPVDIFRRTIAPMLGLTKKGGRRRRKTRKSRK